MVKANFDGATTSKYPKVNIPNDTWDAEIKEVGDVQESPKWGKPDDTEEKVILGVWINVKGANVKDKEKNLLENAMVPMFLTAVVSKGSGDYNSSKLYEILEQAGEMDNCKKIFEEINKQSSPESKNKLFVDFLRQKLVGRRCRATTKAVNKGKDNEYSKVAEIPRFLNGPKKA